MPEETNNELDNLIAEEFDPEFDKELTKSMRKEYGSSSSSNSGSSSAPTQPTTNSSTRRKIPSKGEKKETETKGKEETNKNRKGDKNNKKKTSNEKKETRKKKEKNNKEEEGKEGVKAWVSILAVPKRKGLAAEIQGLYRELAKYAIRALVDRQGRKVEVSEEEQQLLQRWKKNDRELNLEERHGGKLEWKVKEEGGKERENNRILSEQLVKARKEVVSLKERVGRQVENSKVDTEVGRRVEEYKREVRGEKEEELKRLRQENNKLLIELGGKKRELELMIEQMKRAGSRRRGKKKKREEDAEEEGARKMVRSVGAVGEVRKGEGLKIEASIASNS